MDEEFDASDLQAVNDRKSKLGRQRAADLQVVKNLLATEAGRSWVWRFLEFCHVYSQSFDGEALSTVFNEGQRSVGNRLLLEITKSDPDAYVAMMKESAEKRYEP